MTLARAHNRDTVSLTVPVRQLYSPQTVGVIVVSLELQFELHIVLGLPDHPHEET